MCGRYAHSATEARLVEEFEIDRVIEPLPGPDYNTAPTDQVPAVLTRVDHDSGRPQRRLAALRWGLVPSWAKDVRIGPRMINARLETVAQKPAFRKAFLARRCLLPADGYYEWRTLETPGGKSRKQPFFIHHPDQQTFVMAGLYEFWRDPARDPEDPEAWVRSCTVITTDATDSVGHIHDRMPLTVPQENWTDWLDPELQDPSAVFELIGVSDQLEAYPVSPAVGNVANNSPELVEPLPSEPIDTLW
ncbi:SOS response-associated peptidase [Naumannella halotolerans]|uniref:Abasic site processing protein n=1 Tax=Naumannella halotolerans TaxID=993414 RepID=A0A4R7J867_9ACTN|nr:SOS response-associated peptidase [Naumannella halotolerans]TDT33671.1 putative SOS response-associated peptidase YedK [Naumannella halotolerans]